MEAVIDTEQTGEYQWSKRGSPANHWARYNASTVGKLVATRVRVNILSTFEGPFKTRDRNLVGTLVFHLNSIGLVEVVNVKGLSFAASSLLNSSNLQ
jgi:hypothetical protein